MHLMRCRAGSRFSRNFVQYEKSRANYVSLMHPTSFHLAEINIARGKAPLDAPVMRDFVELLDAMNALADASPGFIWRLKEDKDDSSGAKVFNDPQMLVNLSVWTDAEALRQYAYKSSHAYVFRKRKEWFVDFDRASLALWWIEAGTLPTVEEARHRLELLDANGPTAQAFTFRTVFPAPLHPRT